MENFLIVTKQLNDNKQAEWTIKAYSSEARKGEPKDLLYYTTHETLSCSLLYLYCWTVHY